MRKIFPGSTPVACLLMILLSGSGCMKDKISRTYQYYAPVYQTLTQARSVIKITDAVPVQAPEKISLYKNDLFVVDSAKGVHIIDNSDPAHPKNISFIRIPGVTDIAVAGGILYANDIFGDLVSADIGDPGHAVIKKYLANIFPSYSMPVNTGNNPDSLLVISGWMPRDTTVSDPYGPCNNCEYFYSTIPGAANIPATIGTNGSMAGFAIVDHYLYAIALNAALKVIDISSIGNPSLSGQISLDAAYETIFPFGDKLFMGSFNGMYIYDLSDPAVPVKQGSFFHVRVCDPVIADGAHAFVTLRSGTPCVGYTNELEILDIGNLGNPVLLQTYKLNNPRGLAKDGDLLFICDGTDGLKIFDATDINQLGVVKNFPGFEADDVITKQGNAIVMAADGIYQFDYSDIQHIQQISKIPIDASSL